MNKLSVSGGLVTLTLGLILWLAVSDRMKGVDLTMIGMILTGIGALWTLLGLVMYFQGNRSLSRTTTVDAHGRQNVVQTETERPMQ